MKNTVYTYGIEMKTTSSQPPSPAWRAMDELEGEIRELRFMVHTIASQEVKDKFDDVIRNVGNIRSCV